MLTVDYGGGGGGGGLAVDYVIKILIFILIVIPFPQYHFPNSIEINKNYTISIRLRTYSSFKAALTAGKVSMLGNCPNLVSDLVVI